MRGLKSADVENVENVRVSHPSRGAWIEIQRELHHHQRRPSHPSRGAWIEITMVSLGKFKVGSHPSRGAWIEIETTSIDMPEPESRTPHGVRGLKLLMVIVLLAISTSHPSRGAWIEIRPPFADRRAPPVAPLTGCVD